MSVRKGSVKAAPRSQSNGGGLLKGILFWGFLFVASFLVGALIISPMINATTGSRAETPSGPAVNPAPPPPSSAPANAAATQPERRRSDRDSEPSIQLVPDSASHRDVQKPQTPDEPAASKDDSTANSDQTGDSTERDRSADQTGDTTSSDNPDRSSDRRRERAQRSDNTPSSDSAPRRRSRRHRRSSETGDTARPPADTGTTNIQRGESIDQP
jgi:hypothetical protein